MESMDLVVVAVVIRPMATIAAIRTAADSQTEISTTTESTSIEITLTEISTGIRIDKMVVVVVVMRTGGDQQLSPTATHRARWPTTGARRGCEWTSRSTSR